MKIFQKVYDGLCEITPKGKSFDYAIEVLIDYYIKNEEFFDGNAEYYNEQIEKFENGNYGGVRKVSLNDLEKRLDD